MSGEGAILTHSSPIQVPQLPAGIWLSALNPGSEDLVVFSAGGQSLQAAKLHRREKPRVFSVRFSFALGPSCGYVCFVIGTGRVCVLMLALLFE